MMHTKYIIFYLSVLLFISCITEKNIEESRIRGRITRIGFECNLLDGANGYKIFEPYEMLVDIQIENISDDTLYFRSTNIHGADCRKYGYFLLISPTDSIELNTTFDTLYAFPPHITDDVVYARCTLFEELKKFSVDTRTTPDEVFEKINKYKLLFIPCPDDFPPSFRENLLFSSNYEFDLNFVDISYYSGGKYYFDVSFSEKRVYYYVDTML